MAPVTPRAKSSQVQPTASANQTVTQRTPRASPRADAQVTLSTSAFKPHEVAEDIQTRIKTQGVQDVKNTVRFYGKLLIPALTITAVMFSLYAMISWVVPNRLCEEDILSISGSTLGFSKCVYNFDSNYRNFPDWFWLAFWSIQVAWVPMFPGIVTRAIFGSSMSRVQVITVGVCVMASFTSVLITCLAFNMQIQNVWVNIICNIASLTSSLTCSTAAARHTGNRITRWRYFLLFFLGGQITYLYYFIMPKLLTLRSSDVLNGLGLTIVRLAVHPVIWSAVLLFFRNVMRHIGRVPDLSHMCFLVWPMLYSSLYGRFLLLQLDSVGSVVLIDFMMACVGISSMLVDRGRDQGWLKAMYGNRASYAMQALPSVDEFILLETLTSLTMEASSIFAASALLSFGGVAVSGGTPPQHITIWSNAAIQFVTLIVFTLAQLAANGKFHNVEWEKVYPKSIKRLFFFSLLVLVIGGSRLCVELLLLFCPKYYDEYGILLEQCDKPSLFEAMKSTFVNRNKENALGKWLSSN